MATIVVVSLRRSANNSPCSCRNPRSKQPSLPQEASCACRQPVVSSRRGTRRDQRPENKKKSVIRPQNGFKETRHFHGIFHVFPPRKKCYISNVIRPSRRLTFQSLYTRAGHLSMICKSPAVFRGHVCRNKAHISVPRHVKASVDSTIKERTSESSV